MKLCLDPNYEPLPEKLRRQPGAQIGNHGNGVNFVDEVDSHDWGVYLWGENCLRKVNDLDEFSFEKLKELVLEEHKRRNDLAH